MMTDTLVGVSASTTEPVEAGDTPEREPSAAELAAIEGLVRQARDHGVALTGPAGLLKALTKTVLETALDEEMAEHVGYDKHAPEGRNRGNSRNGTRSKTVLTDSCGEVEIEVPRDRDGSFDPQLVKKRQRRLSDVDEIVLSLYAKGLTTGEISAHFADVYGASVSKDTVSRITDRVIEEMQAWWARPLEKVYAAVFIDAIVVKIRDGQVRNKPVYAAIGVDLDGHKDILGMWAGDGDGESAKVLACGAHRAPQPRREGHLLRRLRRAEGPARQRDRGVPPRHGADLHHPPDPQHLPLRVAEVPGADLPRHATDLHRTDRRRGQAAVCGVR
jgi:putative transposase